MELHFEISEADLAMMKAAEQEHLAAEEIEMDRGKRVLERVAAMVSKEVYGDILACIDESGYVFDFQIEDRLLGNIQDDGYAFGSYYVNQTTNGGYTGDDFAGTISIPLPNGLFFKYGYSM